MGKISKLMSKAFSDTGREFTQYIIKGDIVILPVLGIRGVIEKTRNPKVWKVRGGSGILFFVHKYGDAYECTDCGEPVIGDTLREAVARGLVAIG